ncbi:MAG TPA: carbamoyltransferase [Candidatus Krumholzibacteria bacterium]|jgi:carbamoyltransferase|nr:carbamoyltransferase [Candidatus Krumholzibacteria bacterium]
MYILGISCYYHDSAAALLKDGEIIAAAQEERFTRIRHDQDFPEQAVKYCLKEAGITIEQVDYIGFYDKPMVKFERILQTYIATWPRSFPSFIKSVPMWLQKKLWIPSLIKKELGYEGDVLMIEHHLSHAASSYLVSPYDDAAIVTVDGVGEWATSTICHGVGSDIKILKEIRFPHSLGLLYSAYTYYLGFKVNSAEYKVMGLAPYGEPKYVDKVMETITYNDDGSFKMNMKYFAYDYGLRMTNKEFEKLFGQPTREPESKLEQFHKDVAMSVQVVTEEIVLRMVRHAAELTGSKNLCMAGGVALNCVANGRVVKETPYKDVFIQPAAGDAGGAVGVATYLYHTVLGNERKWKWEHAYLGPEYKTDEIRKFLDENGIVYKEFDENGMLDATVQALIDQKTIGWFQGRMEFGPRALGARSIIADARNPENKTVVNLKIKFRESFRPFAPSVLEEKCNEWFELDIPSPYMLLVADVREGKRTIPAVTHVDQSARIQTVNEKEHARYYNLIKRFDEKTGCPLIINTSFNVRGEPIVCKPDEAYTCFMRTNMDVLVLDKFVMYKPDQKPFNDDVDWRTQFALD